MNIEAIKKANQLLEIKEDLEFVKKHYYEDNKHWFNFLHKNLKLHLIKFRFKNNQTELISMELNMKTREFLLREVDIKIKEIDNQIKQIEC
jgi:hypothetical protein